jgi:hypothetical protein
MGSNPTTTQTQQSQSSPWAPTQPALTSLLGNIGNLPTAVTPGQQGAVNNLQSAADGLQNYAPQAGATANSLFAGGGANNQAGTVQGAYNSLQGSLSPLTNSANLNPYNTPGFADAMSKMNSDIGNSVNDRFAAAGRDLSPGNSTALATGLSQGEGQLIANQYNANASNLTNASNSLYGAGLNTGNALSGYNQTGNQNQLAGASLAQSIPGLATAPGQAQLGAANTAQGLPGQNLAGVEGLLTPLAALGGQSSGTSTSQTQVPLWQQLLGGAMGGAGAAGSLFGAPAGGTSAAAGMMSMFSDERVKENKERVGELHDGSPVWSYNYIGDPTPRIGLMAQEVERRRPDAVTEIGGIKAVDYGKATERARAIGGLLDRLSGIKKAA